MMMGFLAFLLTFTVIGANFSFLQKASQEEQLNDIYPYDIMYTDNLGFESDGSEHTAGFSPDEAEKSSKIMLLLRTNSPSISILQAAVSFIPR